MLLNKNDCFYNDMVDEIKTYVLKIMIRKLKISNIKHSTEYIIINRVLMEWLQYGGGVYSNVIYKKIKGKVKKTKFYDTIDKLKNNKLIKKSFKDGLIYLELHPTIHKAILNLIKYMQNSNKEVKKIIKLLGGRDNLKPSEIKYNASKLIYKNKLTYKDKILLKSYFEEYLEKIDSINIVFKRLGVSIPTKKDILTIPYTTRFNCKYKKWKKINDYEEIIKNASKKYNYAFFITLTTDIKQFKTIKDSAKAINENFNKLMSYIKKKLGYRPEYIKSLEFHNNGSPHLHILIFSNSKWLMPQKELSRIWKKYGQGEITYIYLLKSNGNSFIWLKNKPKKTKSKDITDYLTKYLKKAFYDNLELCLFWITNLRFYTYSRSLLKKEPKIKKPKQWEFIGVFDILDLLDINHFIDVYIIPKKGKNYINWFGDTIYMSDGGYIQKINTFVFG